MAAPAVPDLLFHGPADGRTVVLAHGAGAPMDSPFMATMTAGLVSRGIRVGRFEFPYMAARRSSGQRKPPDRAPVLHATWAAVIDTLAGPLVIGGKSMGGRIASEVAAEDVRVSGVVCLGYPFHPAGKPERLRTAHLEGLAMPTLIVQGERDALGSKAEVPGYALSPAIQLVWLPDGDHSFRPRKTSGHTEAENLTAAVDAVACFVAALQACWRHPG